MIAKLKEKLPKNTTNILGRYIKKIDVKALLIGLSCVTILYGTAYAYVILQSDTTLERLKNSMPSASTTVFYKEKKSQRTKTKKNKFLIKGLSQSTNFGDIPKIRKSDYLTSFNAYQTPFSLDKSNNKPVLSFIIKDYGLSKQTSQLMLDVLPPETSLILSPYSLLSEEWIAHAHNKGHEIWLHMPIQNEFSNDLGQNTIFHHAAYTQKQKALHINLADNLGYVGITSFTDESLKKSKSDYADLFDEVYARGLGYLELNPAASNLILGKALTKGYPYIQADTYSYIITGEKVSVESLEKIAQKKGYVVAIIPAYPAIIKNLASWLIKVGKINYQIAPVSAMYDIPRQRESIKPTNLRQSDLIEPEKEARN